MAEFQAAAATGGISSHVHFQRECQTSEEEESRSSDLGGGGGGTGKGISQTQIIQSSSGGGGGGEGASGKVEVAQKPRGRPRGSKNKPKPPIIITGDNKNAMRPHVLEVAVGCDVGESVLQFVRRRQIGLCIISGSGTVASVTLRQPTVSAAPLNFRGRFEILSLSGMYLPSASPSSSSSLSGGLTMELTISLPGAQGRVVGGSVAGELTAAGPVTIIAASFTSPSYNRLPAELDEENAANSQLQNNEGSLAASTGHGHPLPNDSCGGMAIYSNPISSQLSPDALAWATGLRTPY